MLECTEFYEDLYILFFSLYCISNDDIFRKIVMEI